MITHGKHVVMPFKSLNNITLYIPLNETKYNFGFESKRIIDQKLAHLATMRPTICKAQVLTGLMG